MGKRYALLVSLAFALAGCGGKSSRAASGLSRHTEIVLWAWHGAHDLRFLEARAAEARTVSVAYLARRIVVGERHVQPQLRSTPLRLADETRRTAVVRIEAATGLSERAFQDALPQLRDHLNVAAHEPLVTALQIDFDAPARLRPAYRELLREARALLSPGQRLEMTALASWCLDDQWVEEGLVDAVVPMLFEMGPTASRIRARLASARLAPLCQGAVGVSATDVLPPLAGPSRVFIFAPGPWSEVRVDAVEKGLETGDWRNARQKGWGLGDTPEAPR